MGIMEGWGVDCRTLELSGPIEKIRASWSENDQAVSAIRYFKGRNSLTYGNLLTPFSEWEFSETNVLFGIHGQM